MLEEGPNLPAEAGGASRTMLTKATALVSIVMCLHHIAFISFLYHRLGIYLMLQPHIGISLGFILVLAFLIFPAKKGVERVKLLWYDYLFILGAVVSTGYYAFFYDTILDHVAMGVATTGDTILFVILVITMLEAARRVVGLAMPIIVAAFILYSFTAEYFPSYFGFLVVKSPSLGRLAGFLFLSAEGIFGIVMRVAATIIIIFLIFSQFLTASGAGRFFIDIALSLFGRVRGGPAKAAVFASAGMATMSGTISGNVAATGSITIPMMKSIGYSPEFAGAVEAVASKGGQLTPPVMGAIAFVMAEVTGIPYWTVAVAAAVPAALYFLAVFIQVDLEAGKLGLRGLPRSELPSRLNTLKEGWLFLVPLIMLVVFLGVLKYSPAQSGLYSAGVMVLVSLFKKRTRMGPKKILDAFAGTGRLFVTAGVTVALAGIILGVLGVTGVGIRLATGITILAGGNTLLLALLTAFVSFVMGMGMGSIAIYITLAVLVAPALVHGGVTLIAAHLFIVYWGAVSFITPPVALAAYVAAAIAKGDPMKTGWIATRLAIVTFVVPFIFLYNPAILLVGPTGTVVLAVITAIPGVCLLAVGVEGYLIRQLNLVQRAVLIGGGILLIIPSATYSVIGLIIGVLALIPELVEMRRIKRGRGF